MTFQLRSALVMVPAGVPVLVGSGSVGEIGQLALGAPGLARSMGGAPTNSWKYMAQSHELQH